MGTKCFLVQKNGEARFWLRRYHSDAEKRCPGPLGYHNAEFLLGDFKVADAFEEYEVGGRKYYRLKQSVYEKYPKTDARYPFKCDHCDYLFTDTDCKQIFDRWIYTDAEGRKYTLDDLPVGAMWVEDWMPVNMYWDNKTDGHLHVKTPGGDWNIDSRASNCTMPNDRLHRCWVRHGEPPNITADKNGFTCSAGAGSIMCGNYHGFLRNGELT